jgi:thioredoxin reductase
MTSREKGHHLEQIDFAILGGGPGGLQAAMVLSRTRKKIVVFDDPEPPRNAASHGVHNFLGLDGEDSLQPFTAQKDNPVIVAKHIASCSLNYYY